MDGQKITLADLTEKCCEPPHGYYCDCDKIDCTRNLRRCHKCRGTGLKPTPEAEEIFKFFERYAKF